MRLFARKETVTEQHFACRAAAPLSESRLAQRYRGIDGR